MLCYVDHSQQYLSCNNDNGSCWCAADVPRVVNNWRLLVKSINETINSALLQMLQLLTTGGRNKEGNWKRINRLQTAMVLDCNECQSSDK